MRFRALLRLLAVSLALAPGGVMAHEVRPGLLELQAQPDGRYTVLWKKPAGGEVEVRIAPSFPDSCQLSGGAGQLTPGAIVFRGALDCDAGLAGQVISIAGLETTITDVLLRVHHADGRLESHVLRPASSSVVVGAVTGPGELAWNYTRLGIEHILLGVDHLLFVLGLMLIARGRWVLFKTITAFTVAHSITLAVATMGYAQAPAGALNVAIALSILFLAPEMVRASKGQTSLTIRRPWWVAFAFGLLHGFGFASGLSTTGLPPGEIPFALLMFNLGVEAGQLGFVLLILAMAKALQVLEASWPAAVRLAPAYVVGSLGAFWTLQRGLAWLGGLRW